MASIMMQTIMWHVKRLLGKLYVRNIELKKVVDNILNHLLHYDTQPSMQVTTSQMELPRPLTIYFML
jgi:hypothetical protein